MLRRVFMAPDPGRLRLRSATRAVLGVGTAAGLCGLAGFGLDATITGGLAALIALLVITEGGVREQAVTTALVPFVALPTLTLAALLHDLTPARDLAFLAVVGGGVYARRWGPRGHCLGILTFLMFFAAQFLHAVPARLPGLCTAVLLSLAGASAVRFGAWCYERRLPPVTVAAPPGGTGLARATTRQALQATAGATFALYAGQAVSGQRWYWAVAATWWIFVNAASRGETLVRGFRRLLGTLLGAALCLLVAAPLHGAPVPTAVLAGVCVFGVFYSIAVSYTWMMLWITLLVGSLYGALGILGPGLLVLRLAETCVGALGAALGVLLVLPVTTHAVSDGWIRQAAHAVQVCTAEATARLRGDLRADPMARVRELDQLRAKVRYSMGPLVHPLNPMRERKRRALHILTLFDDCAREIRVLTTAPPCSPYGPRVTTAYGRVRRAAETLSEGRVM